VFEASSARFGVGGREVFSLASQQVAPPHAPAWARGAGARGDLFDAAGVGEGVKRSEICSPATCDAPFGARRRAKARRRTICSPARCSARVGVGEGALACRSTARHRGECSSARVGAGEGVVACGSTAWRRGDVFLSAPQHCVLRLASFPLGQPLLSLLRHDARFDSKKGDFCPSRLVHERHAAGCGVKHPD